MEFFYLDIWFNVLTHRLTLLFYYLILIVGFCHQSLLMNLILCGIIYVFCHIG